MNFSDYSCGTSGSQQHTYKCRSLFCIESSNSSLSSKSSKLGIFCFYPKSVTLKALKYLYFSQWFSCLRVFELHVHFFEWASCAILSPSSSPCNLIYYCRNLYHLQLGLWSWAQQQFVLKSLVYGFSLRAFFALSKDYYIVLPEKSSM